MRVLLTGASGFVGGHVAAALAADGHTLRVLARPTSDLSRVQDRIAETALADLREDTDLGPACAGIDAVVHVAGVTRGVRPANFHDVNAAGTARLAAAAVDAGVARFILVSSLAAQGPSASDAPADPRAPRAPVSAYGASKAAGEDVALRFADRMAVQVLRPPLVYGPGDRALLPFFQLAQRRLMLRLGAGRSRIAAIYGPDFAEATAALLTAQPGPSPYLHIADAGGPYTWNDLIDALGDAVGKRLFVLPLPALGWSLLAGLSTLAGRALKSDPLLDAARVAEMRQPAWLADSEALQALSGWRPRTALADGLRETVAWYRAQRWL